MEKWKRQLRAYKERGRPADKRHEDLLAVRMLRGLGIAQPVKGIYEAEKIVWGETRGERPLWDRATAVLLHKLKATRANNLFPHKWDIQAFKIKNSHEAIERLAAIELDARIPVLFCRIRDTIACNAYMLIGREQLGLFKPPFAVPAEVQSYFVLQQPVDRFVDQFGPYDWGG